MKVNLRLGDALLVLAELENESVDSIVTDPPYGLAFMGKKWDYDVPSQAIWEECLRVLKPGGHLLAFAGSRTYHRMTVRIEDAGFDIRDQLMWLYGSGFPKSQNIGKAIDKAAGAKREVVGIAGRSGTTRNCMEGGDFKGEYMHTVPATEAAKQWEGWGSALKPAHEPIVMARKPFKGSLTKNVLENGTGALNIDACRVALNGDYKCKANGRPSQTGLDDGYNPEQANQPDDKGRWPANVIHDGSEEVQALFPDTSSSATPRNRNVKEDRDDGRMGGGQYNNSSEYGDKGSAARYFYCAKASTSERHLGCEAPGEQFKHGDTLRKVEDTATSGNTHPTVKPIALMKHLIALVTPPGGTVLDPFMGSGTTGMAAAALECSFIGIEREEDFFNIAFDRVNYASKQKATA